MNLFTFDFARIVEPKQAWRCVWVQTNEKLPNEQEGIGFCSWARTNSLPKWSAQRLARSMRRAGLNAYVSRLATQPPVVMTGAGGVVVGCQREG